MTLANFREFVGSLVVEELHPELQSIVKAKPMHWQSKQENLAKKIRQITKRGEKTGIEGNMPKGSARAYLPHQEPHHAIVDGKPGSFKVGTKVAIHSALDPHHKHENYDGMKLGAMQNHAEGGDHWVNQNYRILHEHPDKPGEFKSNHESGIFPPLIDHDHENHEWSHVGHARDIKPGEFQKLTKTPTHPKGINHKDFYDALNRRHDQNMGKYRGPRADDAKGMQREKHLDHIDEHPLVQKFHDYHGNTGNPPSYLGKRNMGIFEHPDGSHHIVARDHGFNTEVMHAYQQAKMNKMKKHRGY